MNNPYAASNASMDGSMPPQTGQTYDAEIFALHGRLGRIRFLVYGFIIHFVALLAAGVLLGGLVVVTGLNIPDVFDIFGLLVYSLICAATFIMAQRRLNDLDQSGWLGLLLILPVVNFFFGLYLLFAPGTRGHNRYGAEPFDNNTVLIVFAWIFPLVSVAVVGIWVAVAIPAHRTATVYAGFSEVVGAAIPVKMAVEICVQNNARNGVIAGCRGGANGVPPDVTSPNGMVASVTTADNGVITATAINDKSLQGQTFILIPAINNGIVSWVIGGTCKEGAVPMC